MVEENVDENHLYEPLIILSAKDFHFTDSFNCPQQAHAYDQIDLNYSKINFLNVCFLFRRTLKSGKN